MSGRASRAPGSGAVIVAVFAILLVASVVGGQRWRQQQLVASRAVPVHAGGLSVTTLREPVEVLRDHRGVPRVLAQSELDAWRGLGFVHAQDRLAQMLWLRRLARGEISEVIGVEGLPADRFARTLGIGRLADAHAKRLPPEVRRVLAAYADGINARLERVRSGAEGMPLSAVDWPEPTAWAPGDSVAILKLISWASGSSVDTALVLSDLIERLGGLGARPFFPTGEEVQAVTIPVRLPPYSDASPVGASGNLDSTGGPADGIQARTSGSPTSSLPKAAHAGDATPKLASRPNPGAAARAEAILGVAGVGGNAVVLGPQLTRSRAPVLAAQLHLVPTAPSLVYESVIRAGDWEVAGSSVPGVPIFWIGRTAELAWAVTPARAVSADLYLVTLSPSDPTRYHQSGRWVKLKERSEIIRVRDELGSVREENWTVQSTRQGPLVNALLDGDREPLALGWTGAREGDAVSALLGLVHAENGEALYETLRKHHDPVVTVAWIDSEGNGGAKVAGWIPRRILPTGLVPVPARMRAFQWSESVDFDALPERRLSEDVAWVVAADEPLEEGHGSSRIEWLWRPGLQAHRLDELVRTGGDAGRFDPRSAAALLTDRRAPQGNVLIESALQLAEADRLSPGGREAVRLLRHWDRELDADSGGALVYRLFVDHLTDALFSPVLGSQLLERYLALPHSDSQAMLTAIVRGAASAHAPAGWSDRGRVTEAVLQSLDRTWVSLGFRLGANPQRWSWGRLHPLRFAAFAGIDGTAAGLDAVPAPGDASTLFLADPRPRPGDRKHGAFPVSRVSGYRAVITLGSDGSIHSATAPGQSEHPAHSNYGDRLETWLAGGVDSQLETADLASDAGVARLTLEPTTP